MKTRLSALLLLALAPVGPAQAGPLAVTWDAQRAVAVTIYNGNLGLVRDVREARLPTGRQEVQFEDVATQIDPTTVHLGSLTDPAGLTIVEQNYEYDLLSSQKLLEKYVGKRVRLYDGDGAYHEATHAPTRPRAARAASAPPEPARRAEPAAPAAPRADDFMAKGAAAPAASRSMTGESTAAVLPGLLTVRDRAYARRALAGLVARLGGAELSEHPDEEAVVVEVVLPAAAYAEFVRGLGRFGTWAAAREPVGAPVRVRVTLKSSG